MNALRNLNTLFSPVLSTLSSDSNGQLRPTVGETPCVLRNITVTSRISIGGLPEIRAEEQIVDGEEKQSGVTKPA